MPNRAAPDARQGSWRAAVAFTARLMVRARARTFSETLQADYDPGRLIGKVYLAVTPMVAFRGSSSSHRT